jgi:putative ABC transport system substrate-binding protein
MAIRFRRREFIALGSAAAAWPLAARAQQGDRVRRIGVLMSGAENDGEMQARLGGPRQGLSRFGWQEGRNVRSSTGLQRQMPNWCKPTPKNW